MKGALAFAGFLRCDIAQSPGPAVGSGGEFERHALFFYKRAISISPANSDFHRADVRSDVTYAAGEK